MQYEQKQIKGLIRRGNIYHIDIRLPEAPKGRLRESTGKSDIEEAIAVKQQRINEIRNAANFGIRPTRLFIDAATMYLEKNQDKKTIENDAYHLRMLVDFMGDLPLKKVHHKNVEPFIIARKTQGVKNATINRSLEIVNRILFLAHSEWVDDHDLTWLDQAPYLRMLDEDFDARPAYPLHYCEQVELIAQLPPHLALMTRFKINTGLRENEVCELRWSWEEDVPELNTTVFIVPGEYTKNGCPRPVALNEYAKSIVETCRGRHPTHVFSSNGKPITVMNNTGWQRARIRAAVSIFKKLPEVEYIEESMIKTRTGALAVVKIYRPIKDPRKDTQAPLVACYSINRHDQDRMENGYPPMTRSQRTSSGTRQLIRYKALRRAIDHFAPQLSEFARVRVHDCRPTFSSRLRAARVPRETRALLLGHKNGDITTHYSIPEYQEMIDAVSVLCNQDPRGRVMNVSRTPYTKPKYGRFAKKKPAEIILRWEKKRRKNRS